MKMIRWVESMAEHSNIQWDKSVDSNIEVNKKGCEGYRKKDDETDSRAISAEPVVPITCTPIVIERSMSLPFTDEIKDSYPVSVATSKTKVLTNEQRGHINKRRREIYHEKKQSMMPCDVDRRESIKQRRREARHAKEAKSKKTHAQRSREYKIRKGVS